MAGKPSHDEAEKTFTEIFHAHADAIFRHCAFKLFDRQLAADLTQETFLRVWQQIERGKEIENMKAFLYRVADNLVIDHVRKKKAVSLDLLQERGFDPGQDDLPATQNRMEMQRALAALQKLEEPYRTAIQLRYVEGLTVTEIAALTSEPPNTVSVRIHRGLQQLRSHLHHG